MKITTISASVRYSRDIGNGQWKVIELGAEGTIDGQETWTDAQASLYHQLGQQLRTLWAGNGADRPNGEGASATTSNHQPPKEHWCQEHQTDFKRYTRGDAVWYAHKKPDGKWCREK